MAYPVAAGVPTHSGTYTPEIWTGKTLVKFYTATIFSDIANTDYEGEIKKQGDKVIIRTIPDIAINDHAIDQDLNYETPEGGTITLNIDQGKSYSFKVNKIQETQADIPYFEKWTDDAGQRLAMRVDSSVLGSVYADAALYNAGTTAGFNTQSFNLGVTGTPVALDKTNILDFIVDMRTCLDEYDVPTQGRWLAMPPVLCGLVMKSELKDASLAGDGTSMYRNGRMGELAGFMVYQSNAIAISIDVADGNSRCFNIMAGHPSAITFASQLVEHETIPNPKTFGKLVRGLQVYGFEVVKGEALVHGYVKKV